jgi:hypothetical protein
MAIGADGELSGGYVDIETAAAVGFPTRITRVRLIGVRRVQF